MRGLIALLLVVVAVSTVRSQGPPTRTKSGPPPSRRRNDNPDYGMPSGKDVPDGRRFPAGPPPAPKMARPAPPKRAAPPRKVAKAPARRPARPGDNPDFGMPSGKDVPDGRRFAAPPQAAKMPASQMVTRLRAGKRPRFMPPVAPRRFIPAAPPAALPPMAPPAAQPPAFSYSPYAPPAAPAAPPAAAPPAPGCNCGNYYAPVCSFAGNTFDNECWATCNAEYVNCDHECPCAAAAPPPPPAAPVPIDDCTCGIKYSPVCGANGEVYDSDCHARCENQKVQCDGHCPCDT